MILTDSLLKYSNRFDLGRKFLSRLNSKMAIRLLIGQNQIRIKSNSSSNWSNWNRNPVIHDFSFALIGQLSSYQVHPLLVLPVHTSLDFAVRVGSNAEWIFVTGQLAIFEACFVHACESAAMPSLLQNQKPVSDFFASAPSIPHTKMKIKGQDFFKLLVQFSIHHWVRF